MFITLQDSIINIEEIRNVSSRSDDFHVLRIYFKNSSSPADYLSYHYDNGKDLKKDFKALTEACEAYNKNKIKN